ncbi:c-type cytochrome [Lysobacter cavernae]|uniref:C-type cytochrome n=1 Tax=Lysobacter cavernae TaxID=1685901 RepID=A0ABV7RKV8_9GAMM
MTIELRRPLLIGLAVLTGGIAIATGVIWSGAYNVAADDRHSAPVNALLQVVRERSIAVRARGLTAPDLTDPTHIRQGAGNYDAMCAGCHLAPGVESTELSRGLYPAPPDLTRATVDAAEAFWVIKHGIKASGMPAWGKSMGDDYLWNMVAFLQQLPSLDADEYRALVTSSDGHSHGRGETMAHGHDAAASPGHPEPAPQADTSTHHHADGKEHVHEGAPKPVTKPDATSPTGAVPAEEHGHHPH